MSRIKTAVVMLIITATICTVQYLYVAKTVAEFTGILDEVQKEYADDNKSEALKIAENADRLWKKRIKYVDIFLFHDYVDNISYNLLQVSKYVEYEEDASLYVTCDITKKQLKSLTDSEKPLVISQVTYREASSSYSTYFETCKRL